MLKCRHCRKPLSGQKCLSCNGKGFIEGIGGREIQCLKCLGDGETTESRVVCVKDSPNMRAKWHFYGGWVCSMECDRKATIAMRGSFPGAGPCRGIDPREEAELKMRWGI